MEPPNANLLVYDNLNRIDRGTTNADIDCLLQTPAVDEHMNFSYQDGLNNQSFTNYPNAQMITDVNMSDESSVNLPIHSAQGIDVT
ncbi:unnamed protein product [Adineta steineri]|nr:unnamed protein product [Adineta steineri]CAF1623422.1 unnamed protein product [Adineta steineri]